VPWRGERAINVPDRGGASDGAKQAPRRGAAPDSTTGTSAHPQPRAIHSYAPQAARWQNPDLLAATKAHHRYAAPQIQPSPQVMTPEPKPELPLDLPLKSREITGLTFELRF
jgi:hypothetical protein